jgi:REP element-mobilizing transposase RayT
MSADNFKNKYRIPSARAQWWDYGSNASYFITICTENREHYFGEIYNSEMQLSEIGKIVNICWREIPQHFPFVELDAFVIMPNHVHGIVVINKSNEYTTAILSFAQSLNKFGPQSQNLASIIRGFKIGVAKNARLIHADFAWQTRFHDHIIRNGQEYRRIANYIIHNPDCWQDDVFYNE